MASNYKHYTSSCSFVTFVHFHDDIIVYVSFVKNKDLLILLAAVILYSNRIIQGQLLSSGRGVLVVPGVNTNVETEAFLIVYTV